MILDKNKNIQCRTNTTLKTNCNPLDLEEYRNLIHLDESFINPDPVPEPETDREFLVDELLLYLDSESVKKIEVEEGIELSSYNLKRQKLYSLSMHRWRGRKQPNNHLFAAFTIASHLSVTMSPSHKAHLSATL
ncbi:unnamed protein product [marine sediment metagenome]|uniref:Uncharacterized protein n=1 Tax=marine sediment metagenome TaxID=412755 RepID=X1KZ33_9ZZZZ